MQFQIMNNDQLYRDCPVCLNTQVEVLHTLHFTVAKDSPLPSCYEIVSCSRCGFVYANTSANQAKYDEYYTLYSKYEDPSVASGGGHTSFDKKRIDEMVSQLEVYIPNKQARIIDIGCGNGGVLRSLKQRGYNNLHGVDPSSGCINHLNNHIDGENYALRLSEIQRFSSVMGKYNFVILSHVLEHIADLVTAMLAIKSILAEDGVVYVEVPDASRYVSHAGVPFYYFDCEHINHFDRCALGNLATITAFEMFASGEKELQLSQSMRYPAVFGLFRLAPPTASQILQQCDSLTQHIKQYIELSKNHDEFLLLQTLASSQQPIILWGAGSYTQRLLMSSPLPQCNIIAIVDGDSRKQGLILHDIKIESPDKIFNKSNECSILICAAIYAADIQREIFSLGLTNKVMVV